MKDALGHGSDAKGLHAQGVNKIGKLEGAAAHRSMVQKLVASGDVHGAMVHTLTRYDREQEARGKGYNAYALGHYLGAAQRISDDIKSGASHGDAINAHTNGPLAARLHKALNTGMKPRKY